MSAGIDPEPVDEIYGVMAMFDHPDDLVAAARRTRDAGYRRVEAYTPYPVEGLAEELGYHRTSMSLIVLVGALCGAVGGYFLEWYASVISYPINVGGRPLHSWPSFIPITFEMAVLAGGLSALFGMLALNGLPKPYHPVFNAPQFDRASRDRFFLCIEAADPRFDPEGTRRFLAGLGAREVDDVPA